MEVKCHKCEEKVFIRDAWHGVLLSQTDNWQIDESLKVTCPKCTDASTKDKKN